MKTTRRNFVARSAAILAAGGLAETGNAGQMNIFEAATAGNLDRVRELCKADPEVVNSRAENGRTPLYFAAEAGQVEMVGLLSTGMFQAAELNAGSENALIPIADYRDPTIAADMARPLLANNCNATATRNDGVSALHLAAARRNVEVARMLIHRGAVVDPKDEIVRRAVPDAAKIERVYFGGRYTQDLRGNKPDRDGTQGLPQGSGLSQFSINEFVALAHFDVDKVKQMHKDSAALLATRATWDESAIEAAAHMGLEPLAWYLADAGSPISTCTAAILGLTDTVRTMIREDRNRLRERGAHDFPLLSFTAFGSERAEIAELLLKAGADPNAIVFGSGALHVAAGKGYLEVAGLLLDHGAEVNAVSRSSKGQGPTPLAVAVQKNQSKMAELLRSRGGKG